MTCCPIANETVDCAFPANLDDADLTSDRLVSPDPPSIRTFTAYEVLRFRVGIVQREYQEKVVLDSSYSYSTVLKLDAQMRCAFSLFYRLSPFLTL